MNLKKFSLITWLRPWLRLIYMKSFGVLFFKIKIHQEPQNPKIIIGASRKPIPGWIPSEAEFLNLLDSGTWEKFFEPCSITALLAEHVWEHLTEQEGLIAASNCFKYLKQGGYLRLAVPDGLHPSVEYIESVKVGGSGLGADDHKVLYTYKMIQSLLEQAGFQVKLYEYFDESGKFHYNNWNPDEGMITRTKQFVARNRDGQLNYTSIVLDAIKTL